MYTTTQAAKILGVTTTTVRNRIKRGKIKALMRDNGRYYIKKSSIKSPRKKKKTPGKKASKKHSSFKISNVTYCSDIMKETKGMTAPANLKTPYVLLAEKHKDYSSADIKFVKKKSCGKLKIKKKNYHLIHINSLKK